MLSIFQYDFIVRGIEAGLIAAVIAPLIGIFLVLRRYSLIADTLSHVSLAGIALGLLLGINPLLSGLAVALAASLGIDRLRSTQRVYGESALAIFLSGSLALAIILLSLGKGLNANLFGYLFGSIVTVRTVDVYTIAALAVLVIVMVVLFYKELVLVTFDEEVARVSGMRTGLVNTLLIMLAAFTVSLSIPIVGVLLISALIVIPVVTALQLGKSFLPTILYAEIISCLSVLAGIVLSFYLDVSTGGTIVLLMVLIFLAVLFAKK